MALVHDAYLFNPERFFDIVFPYLQVLDESGPGYANLRNKALQVFEQNLRVRSLCEEYGGWSRSAIDTHIPNKTVYNLDDVAFWVVILLYSNLGEEDSIRLGLGSDFYSLNKLLEASGWQADQRRLLIWGHHFKDLPTRVHESAPSNSDRRSFYPVWEKIRPFSTSGRAGWLGAGEVIHMYDDLQALMQKTQETADQETSFDPENERRVLDVAIQMLSTARMEETGLCLIGSG